MTDAPLPRAPMFPTEWVVLCPSCGTPIHPDVVETDAGTWRPDGPDRFPLCEHCDVQFEVAEMTCEMVEARR